MLSNIENNFVNSFGWGSGDPRRSWANAVISCELVVLAHLLYTHGPSSVDVIVRPSVVVHNAQRSSPKPLGQSKPNFMWSLLG